MYVILFKLGFVALIYGRHPYLCASHFTHPLELSPISRLRPISLDWYCPLSSGAKFQCE